MRSQANKLIVTVLVVARGAAGTIWAAFPAAGKRTGTETVEMRARAGVGVLEARAAGEVEFGSYRTEKLYYHQIFVTYPIARCVQMRRWIARLLASADPLLTTDGAAL